MIATFHETLLPSTLPSVIDVEFPSAACVPVSSLPAAAMLSVACRVPIGVSMEMFQVPSTAMVPILSRCFLKVAPTLSRLP